MPEEVVEGEEEEEGGGCNVLPALALPPVLTEVLFLLPISVASLPFSAAAAAFSSFLTFSSLMPV